MTDGYRQRVLTALTWSASGELTMQSLRLVFRIALVRLLSPQDFGHMAMLMVIVSFLVGNSDLGFEEALVQRHDVTEVHRSSVFWMMLLVALVLTAGQIAASPWIAEFYGVPELTSLALWLSALFALRAVGVVPRAIATRDLDLRLIASRQSVAIAVAGVCAVLLAWFGFGVASLAAEALVATALESLLLLRASRWHPRRELRFAALRELAGFGVYRPVARTLTYWAGRVDQLLVGKLLGSHALGLYAPAFNLARAPVVTVSRVIVGVLFPSFSLLREDPARIPVVYLRTCGAIALATVPMCMGLCAAARPFVLGVLGPQWHDAIPLVRILSLMGMFQSFSVFATALYLAQGRSDLLLRLTVAQRTSTVVAIVVALRWGLVGIAIAQMVGAAVNAVPTLYFAGRLIGVPLRTVVAQLWRVFVSGGLMAALVLAIDQWAASRWDPLALLALEGVVGVVAYWAALRILRVGAYSDVLAVLRQAARSRRDPMPDVIQR